MNHLLSVKVASVINHILQTGKLRLKKGGITCLTSHGQQVAELRIQGVPCWLCHMVSLQDSFIPTQKRTQVTQGRDTKTHLERHLGKDCWQREKRGLMDLSHPRLSLPSSPPLYFPPHTSFSRGENSHRDAKTHIDAPTRSDSPLLYLPECSAFSPVTVSNDQPPTWVLDPISPSPHQHSYQSPSLAPRQYFSF